MPLHGTSREVNTQKNLGDKRKVCKNGDSGSTTLGWKQISLYLVCGRNISTDIFRLPFSWRSISRGASRQMPRVFNFHYSLFIWVLTDFGDKRSSLFRAKFSQVSNHIAVDSVITLLNLWKYMQSCGCFIATVKHFSFTDISLLWLVSLNFLPQWALSYFLYDAVAFAC